MSLLEHHPYNCVIALQEDVQLPFDLIYNLLANELLVLEEYIKENLAQNFIQYSKCPTSVPIFFFKKK